MSDLCMYEFEDSTWNELKVHIVPRLGEGQRDQFEILHGSHRKPQQQLKLFSRNIDDATIYSNRGKEENHLTTLTRMLEKGPWSDTPDGVFTSCNSDSHKEAASLAQDARLDARISECGFATENVESGNELCANGAILDDKCVLEDNVCQYPLNHISKTDNGLGFLNNDHEDKGNNDILDYGWLDIENFEDVDRMFRSCDSTFGMESLNNDDDLGWLSSSHDNEGSNDALKSDLKFTCNEGGQLASFLDCNGDSKANSLGSSVIDSSHGTFAMDKNMASGVMDVDAEITATEVTAAEITASGPSSVTSEGYIKSEHMDEIMVKEQKKQSRQQYVLKGSRKDVNTQNGDYVHHSTNLKQYANAKHAYAASSNDVLSRGSIQQLDSIRKHGSVSFVQGHGCFMHSDQGHALDHTSPCRTFSTSKSGNNGYSSYSPMESSYASYVESTHGHSSENSALATNEKEKLHYQHNTQVPSRQFKSKSETSAAQSENENEGHSEVETGFPVELESPNVQESSCLSSELEDISVEATSFRQLQKVMDQLDVRTKLCIRDSLYRLAKSAEHRHNHYKGHAGDNGDARKDTMHLDNDRCTGFVDMETETNPIDRSIAHLLFHRPSDPSTLPVNHALPLKSNAADEGPAGAEQKASMDNLQR